MGLPMHPMYLIETVVASVALLLGTVMLLELVVDSVEVKLLGLSRWPRFNNREKKRSLRRGGCAKITSPYTLCFFKS